MDCASAIAVDAQANAYLTGLSYSPNIGAPLPANGFFGVYNIFVTKLNTFVLVNRAYDPYPYILLNLMLSCLAALQAPIIMMSQNRQAEKDRLQSKNDYEVDVKAELEIMQLHEKLNELRERDWIALVEMQQRQIELMERMLIEGRCRGAVAEADKIGR